MYLRAWAVAGSVRVHVDGAQQCVSMKVANAGVRSRYYRRDRPDGSSIDDVEASLSVVEGAAATPLGEIIGGQPLTMERKAVLAQSSRSSFCAAPPSSSSGTSFSARCSTHLPSRISSHQRSPDSVASTRSRHWSMTPISAPPSAS